MLIIKNVYREDTKLSEHPPQCFLSVERCAERLGCTVPTKLPVGSRPPNNQQLCNCMELLTPAVQYSCLYPPSYQLVPALLSNNSFAIKRSCSHLQYNTNLPPASKSKLLFILSYPMRQMWFFFLSCSKGI